MRKEKMNERINQQDNLAEENMIDKEKEMDTTADLENSGIMEEEQQNAIDEDIEQEIVAIEKIKAELEEQKDKYLRLYSEFENFRRRTAKEKLELIKTANENLLSVLLPVIDDFERAKAIEVKPEDAAPAIEGYELIFKKLYKTLEQKGLKRMDVGQGSEFNPEFHDAIAQIPAQDESLKGKVVEVTQQGYYLADKVIRFAKVVIGS